MPTKRPVNKAARRAVARTVGEQGLGGGPAAESQKGPFPGELEASAGNRAVAEISHLLCRARARRDAEISDKDWFLGLGADDLKSYLLAEGWRQFFVSPGVYTAWSPPGAEITLAGNDWRPVVVPERKEFADYRQRMLENYQILAFEGSHE